MITIVNKEELVLLPRWLFVVAQHHCDYFLGSYVSSGNRIQIGVRRVVRGFEVDLVLKCRSGSRDVSVGFELKDSDLSRAVEQALVRRGLFDYFYVVVYLHSHSVLAALKGLGNVEKALASGIGFISSLDNSMIIKSYSRGKTDFSKGYNKIISYLRGDEK